MGKGRPHQNSVSVFSADLNIPSLVFRTGKSWRNSQQQKVLPCQKMQQRVNIGGLLHISTDTIWVCYSFQTV